MFSRYEIDEHNRIEDAKKQGRTIAHTGTLYGVRQETLEAYVAAERKKVWEAAAHFWDANPSYNDLELRFPMDTYPKWGNVFAAWCREQAAKEMSDAAL